MLSISAADGRAFPIDQQDCDHIMRLSDHVWIMGRGRVVGHRGTSEIIGDELVVDGTGAKIGEVTKVGSKQ